ncbi:MAG TPA: outer membrane protein assembly factor BamD [Thermoanaerobaculia bacterium]|jgi:outer membrane protein assembly factor BamD|nr:outer membrane protein assembly factor BamD [Thermoanaerobaculia bacterium]
MKRILPLLAMAGLLVLTTTGCHSGGPAVDPILKLSAEESLAQGKELLAKEKYDKARPYFTHAFEVEPNSTVGRESLLLAADTYYLQGGTTNYVQAEAKYRDFLNRFPTSDQAAYVQFQIANSLAKRMERPDRDQTVTRKATDAYQELIRLYPTSEYAAQSQEQMKTVLDNLAEHEFVIGVFYMHYGAPFAAVWRFDYLLTTYPNYRSRDKVVYNMGVAYQRLKKLDEARKAFDRLRTEFPQSPYIHDIPEIKAGAEAPPAPTVPAKTAANTGK